MLADVYSEWSPQAHPSADIRSKQEVPKFYTTYTSLPMKPLSVIKIAVLALCFLLCSGLSTAAADTSAKGFFARDYVKSGVFARSTRSNSRGDIVSRRAKANGAATVSKARLLRTSYTPNKSSAAATQVHTVAGSSAAKASVRNEWDVTPLLSASRP